MERVFKNIAFAAFMVAVIVGIAWGARVLLADPPPAPPPPLPPELEVTADQMYRDYVANQVYADQTYRGRPLLVTATVKVVRKDFEGTPYIELASPNDLEPVIAAPTSVDGLAELRPGQRIALHCFLARDRWNGLIALKPCRLD